MWNKLFWFFDRAKEKWLRYYRLCVFRAKTGQKAEGCTIRGKMMLSNPNIKVGKNVTFYPNVTLFGDGIIDIGDNVDIGNNNIIYARSSSGGVVIGKNTMIAADCYIIDTNHGIKKDILIREQSLESAPIEIGEDVWIAAGCQIVKGARIDNGAVIGAGSVVNKHIPENAVAMGAPAKVYRYRN